MILTDASGLIIDTEGDARVVDAGRRFIWNLEDDGVKPISAPTRSAPQWRNRSRSDPWRGAFLLQGSAMDVCCRSGSRSRRRRAAGRGGYFGPGKHLQSAEPGLGGFRRPPRGKRAGAIDQTGSRKLLQPLSRKTIDMGERRLYPARPSRHDPACQRARFESYPR